jgi:ABC-type branched-subunit amino acid transport system substrate-binding protein
VRRRSLARGRALLGCAFFATVTGAASCGATGSTVSVSGHTLKIYVSGPPGGGSGPAADVLAAERLAFQQAPGGNKVANFTVKLVTVSKSKLSDNARSAIEDSKTIAYVGEVEPGTSADSVGITNAVDLLQVTPADTALELTQSASADPGSPGRYYEALGTYGRTFARVVPTARAEAKAIVAEMSSVGISKVDVEGDGSTYGKALDVAFRSAAGSSLTVQSSATGAQAVFYAGSTASLAAGVFNQAVSQSPGVKLFAPSALYDPAFVSVLSPAAQRQLYVSSPGFTTAELPSAGKQFVSAFRTAYGRDPVPEAVFGYEAVSAVMHVLARAGSGANSRGTVVHDFFQITNRSSAVGTYSIGVSGDPTFTSGAPFVFGRVKSGKLVPFKQA